MLAQHEPHTAQGGVFCECGDWERYYDGFGSEETYAAHVAAALAAHFDDVRRWVVPNGYAGGPEGDKTTAVMVRLDDLRAELDGTA